MTGELSLVRYGEDSLKARELKQRDNSITFIMIFLATPEAFSVIMCMSSCAFSLMYAQHSNKGHDSVAYHSAWILTML